VKKTITINPQELAKESFDKVNKFLARTNVMAMVKTLDNL